MHSKMSFSFPEGEEIEETSQHEAATNSGGWGSSTSTDGFALRQGFGQGGNGNLFREGSSTSNAPASGFTFGQSTSSTSSFNFGQSTSNAPASGFTFGQGFSQAGNGASPSASGFTFGQGSSNAPPRSFNFGQSTSGLTLGQGSSSQQGFGSMGFGSYIPPPVDPIQEHISKTGIYGLKQNGGQQPTKSIIEEFETAINDEDYAFIENYITKRYPIDVRFYHNNTALINAAKMGNLDTVEFLLSKGADPNIFNDDIETALYHSSKKGFDRISRILINNGARASINFQTRTYYETPMTVRFNHWDDEPGSIRNRMYDAVKFLLDNGADVNMVDGDDDNPLIKAIMHHVNTDVIELLLKYGGDIDHHGRSTRTPLTTAVRTSSVETTKLLLSKGADPHLRDHSFGKNALEWAKDLADSGKSDEIYKVMRDFIYKTEIRPLESIFPNIILDELMELNFKPAGSVKII
jgi:ankyrin repeat protein